MPRAFPEGMVRLEVIFTDEAGTKYDPDSQSLEFYDPTLAKEETKTETDCVKTAVGEWYIDYEIPDDAIAGRWVCKWIATVGTDEFISTEGFEVWSIGWPTVTEVRNYLDAMPADRLSPAVMERCIVDATVKINRIKSASATQEMLFRAYRSLAGYLAYMEYATEYDRAVGTTPGPIVLHIERYKEQAEEWINEIKARGTPVGIAELMDLRERSIEVD